MGIRNKLGCTSGKKKKKAKIASHPDALPADIFQQAIIHHQAGRLTEAEAIYRHILSIEPDHPEALHSLGILAHQVGKNEIAVDLISRAIICRPDYADAHYNLGVSFKALGRLEEAVASFRRALALKPDDVEAHNNLGNTLYDLGKLDEAVTSFRHALELQPNFAEAQSNLGNTLKIMGKLEEAVACHRRALALNPDYYQAYNNLGNALKDQGVLDEAIASYRWAISLQPDYHKAHSNLLFCLNYLPDISQKEIYETSLQFEEQVAKRFAKQDLVYANSREINRRLKIGYVSSDFRTHSVAYFIEPVIRIHNRENVEVYCYANVKKPDDTTRRLQNEADHWRVIAGIPDIEVAERIRRDRIDILVDLEGHTGENRLLIFARKPAPVQVTWIGYPNTTGMAAMDYRFTDAIADPPGEADRLHSEELVRLAHGFLCYQPDASAPQVSPLPSLQQGHITFGSFNNLTKVNSVVIKVWAEIMHRIPGSRLILKDKTLADMDTQKRYLYLFASEGIADDRIEFHGMLPRKVEHLALYGKLDIGLDPFPYNGTTTTCEALWMGVPVVTLLGDRHAGRVGASIMHHAGLEELVAYSREEYKTLAVALAHDHHRLLEHRNNLRRKLQDSPLMDNKLFKETIEKAYQQMWIKWCVTVG